MANNQEGGGESRPSLPRVNRAFMDEMEAAGYGVFDDTWFTERNIEEKTIEDITNRIMALLVHDVLSGKTTADQASELIMTACLTAFAVGYDIAAHQRLGREDEKFSGEDSGAA